MQVFYDSRRFEPLEYDHSWLSDTPDVVGSKTWAGCCPRMVTWIKFLDQRTNKPFYLLNTPFEAFDATARANSARLVLQRMTEQFDPKLPVIATGHFNEAAKPGLILTTPLVTVRSALINSYARNGQSRATTCRSRRACSFPGTPPPHGSPPDNIGAARAR